MVLREQANDWVCVCVFACKMTHNNHLLCCPNDNCNLTVFMKFGGWVFHSFARVRNESHKRCQKLLNASFYFIFFAVLGATS